MRNDTKLAIAVAVVSVLLAIWYLKPVDTNKRPVSPTVDKVEEESQPTPPAALTKSDDQSESARLSDKPGPKQSGTSGSPSAVAVRNDAPRLNRPTPHVSAKPDSDSPLGKSLESSDAKKIGAALVKERTNVGMVSAKTNIATTTRPASTETPLPVAKTPVVEKPVAAKPKLRTHIVEKGDNLWSIAAKYLGDGKRYREIVKLNPKMNPNRINVGDKITIPAAVEEITAVATEKAPSETSSIVAKVSETTKTVTLKPSPIPADRAYKVQVGEGWYNIAQRLLGDGGRWPELYELNKGRVPRNKDILPTGTVIELPKGVKVK